MAADDTHHDTEYLLPTHFLTADDIVSEVMSLKPSEPTNIWGIPIPFGSYGSSSSSSSSSALNSPVESELSSTETESTEEEEEDYIAELTRQMAYYMLQEDDDDDDDDDDKHKIPTFASENPEVSKSFGLSDSAQLAMPSWSPLISSNHGSPKGHNFQEPSPPQPEKAINGKGDIWGLVTDNGIVGGECYETMKVNNEWHTYNHSQKPSILNNNVGLHSHSKPIQLKQEQSVKQQQITKCRETQAKPKQKVEHSRGRACGGSGYGRACGGSVYGRTTIQPHVGRINLSHPVWPHMQTGGSGMRALFLGGSTPRNGPSCGGTGVFLPVGTMNLSESRKKQGCSRVLIPARVVQVLQLHFDRMGALSRPTAGDLPLQHGADASMLSTNSNNDMFSLQKKTLDSQTMTPS